MVSSVLHAGSNDHEPEDLVFGTCPDLPGAWSVPGQVRKQSCPDGLHGQGGGNRLPRRPNRLSNSS